MNEFSVLISIYCKESPLYFREALDSVFAQTLQPAEIVLEIPLPRLGIRNFHGQVDLSPFPRCVEILSVLLVK